MSSDSSPVSPRPTTWVRPATAIVAAATLAAAGWYVFRVRPAEARRAAYLHAVRGLEAYDAGRLDEALHSFEAATRLDPGNARAWYLLGKARRDRDPKESLSALANAARHAPTEPLYHREYGIALREAGRAGEAQSSLTEAVRLAPGDSVAHVELARSHLARGAPDDVAAAISEFRTALSLQPGDVQARFRLMRALYQSGDLAAAGRECGTVLALLDRGARAQKETMDGRLTGSATWLSMVKGCHYYRMQIATREGKREEARSRRRRFTDMDRYIKESYALFQKLNANPTDAAARRALAALFSRFGFPASGPTGAQAAERWILLQREDKRNS